MWHFHFCPFSMLTQTLQSHSRLVTSQQVAECRPLAALGPQVVRICKAWVKIFDIITTYWHTWYWKYETCLVTCQEVAECGRLAALGPQVVVVHAGILQHLQHCSPTHNIHLIYIQLVCQSIWNDIWFDKWPMSFVKFLYSTVKCHLCQSEDWIIYASLTTLTCIIWHSKLSCTFFSINVISSILLIR